MATRLTKQKRVVAATAAPSRRFLCKGVALRATPICRKDWKPFAVLAHSIANINSEPPLRRHAGQPGKSAQVTPNRLRRTQATVAVLAFGSALAAPLARFCHALCPRLNARQIVADRVRRLRTDVNHKRKGKTMSTTNNQSIQQINTAALRGTREAHQPDEIKRASNRKAMEFLERQAVSRDSSAFEAGRFFGSCEALCMASVITATQWQELDELRNKNSTSTNEI